MSLNSPFLKIGSRSPQMAVWVFAALLVPATLYSTLYSSLFVFQLIGYTLIGMMAEIIYSAIIKRKLRLNCTGSGLTAALLTASLPPSMPFWPMLSAILISVWLIKLPMTGLPLRLNAAMTGRLFLMLVFPQHVANWGTAPVDVISTATPQELYRSELFRIDWSDLLFGKIEGNWEGLFLLVPGSPGETFPILLLILGGILCWKGITAWRAPVAYLISFSLLTACFGNNPFFNLFSAATVFSAVFILSDPVSSPMSKGGQLAFGLIVGITNVLIRQFTYYTEAVVYAIILGNLCTPLIDVLAFELRGKKRSETMH